ncbi:uncharacterized protein [Fopius arisanus]|uniref:TNA1 protein n=1 Tax=Fopius arisanus TaxID=64838 RepID=A0A0C9RYX4_9HYME|nr:PREDICTED: uncharacterized protein LOC105271129 [Fopius arisanus]
MHETFHDDPTDVSKRKPRRLRGTPANKWSIGLSFGTVVIVSTLLQLFVNSRLSDKAKKKFVVAATETEEQRLHALMMKDLFFNSVVKTLEMKETGDLPIREDN